MREPAALGGASRRRRLPALGLCVAALVVLALLTLFAIELSSTQASSRADVEARMHQRAVLAGALVESLFGTINQQIPHYERLFGARHVPDRALDDQSAGEVYAALLDPRGTVIAASRGFGPRDRAELVRSGVLGPLRAGHAYAVGNVLPHGSGHVIDVAAQFPTRYGRRILVAGTAPASLEALLAGELRRIPGVRGAQNYVIDGHDTVLASTNPAQPVGYRFTAPGAVRALRRASGERQGRYYATVPLTGSTWRLVVSAPEGPLFAGVTGLHRWVPWLIFIAFALVAAVALLLAARVLRSAQREVDAATEASAMKSNFLANMSHEIRTPLGGVTGMMNLLAETELSDEQREYVDLARSSGEALMVVINDILDVAKIEAGRMEIEHRDFALAEMVEATCDMVAAIAAGKGLELQSFVHDDVPRLVRGDRLRVGQILSNLLSNAVKFTADGEVVVEVTAPHADEKTVTVCFEVRDTGIGIASDRIDALFDPFSQADLGTTRRFGGTGLGLTIAKELSELMGGTIEARSELGTGSAFRFSIPFARAQEEVPEPVDLGELGRLRILVVDDNATNRRIFEAYVASWGMRPEVAPDAPSALAMLEGAAEAADPYDIALLDENMPGESGLDLARRVTAAPALARTRLILLTSSGHGPIEDPTTGIDRCLTKPVRQSRLLDAIAAAMATGPAAGRRRPAGAAVARSSGTGARVLVAEDQFVNWRLAERLLAKRGHTAINARDGREAVEMLEAGGYDLVLMDCQMPVLDGYDATRRIRRREAERGSPPIPIVAMTANAMRGDEEKCLAAGMSDYLPKPIIPEVLDEKLDRWLARASPGRPRPERPPEPDGAPELDPARLATLRSVFAADEFAGMVEELSATISQELADIDRALSRRDREAMLAATHRLKNSAGMIGASRLARVAVRVERNVAAAAPDAWPDDANAIVRELHDRWAAAYGALGVELPVGRST
ncbi:MAG TPA: response regulator [Solirubrobacteraceae bacterium]|nr:response regulator [Solirubrobacteraceae bacterium]